MRLLFLALLFCFAAVPAQAGPLAGAVTAVAGWFTSSAIGGAILRVVVGYGLNYVAQSMRKKRKPDAVKAEVAIEYGDDVALSFILGRASTGGKLKYRNATGPVMVEVIELSCLPQPGLTTLYCDGAPVTLQAGIIPERGLTIPAYSHGTTPLAWIKFFDGTQIAADPNLVALFSGDAQQPWTANHVGRGKTYAVMSWHRHENLQTLPEKVFQPKGLRLYDLRNDSTNGGDGPERWDDPSTWTGTGDENLAICAYNVARGIYWHGNAPFGEWVFGGRNLPAWRLPAADWIAAANACDAQIELAGGGTEPAYSGGCEVPVDAEPREILEALGRAANMRFAEVGGILKPLVGLPVASVMTFSDADVIVTEADDLDPFPEGSKLINGILPVYPEPAEAWAMKEAPLVIHAEALAEDGEQRVNSATYSCTDSPTQVQRLATSALDDYRRWRRHQTAFAPRAMALEPLDGMAWTSARNGYQSKLFWPSRVTRHPDMKVTVEIEEVDPSDDDWSPSQETVVYRATPALQVPPVQTIPGFNAVPATLYDDNGDPRAPTAEITCDDTEIGIAAVVVRWRVVGQTTTSEARFAYDAPYTWYLPALPHDAAIEVQGKLVSNLTPRSAWSAWVALQTDDVRVSLTDLADDVTQAIDDAAISAAADKAAAEAAAAAAEAARDAAQLAETNAETAQGIADQAKIDAQAARDAAQAAEGAAGDHEATASAAATAAETAQGLADAARVAAQGARDAAQIAETAAVAAQSGAETAQDNAETAAANAATAQGLADAAKTAAETARGDAEAAALASSGSADAAAGSATLASSHADDALGYADAASSSATAAQTSAGAASVSEGQAAQSATDADGSAASAATSATTAAGAASDAGDSATAAADSATTAGAHATDAGSSAGAANTAKLAAEAARDGAETAQGAAEVARDDAVTARQDAESAESAASTSATLAATAQVAAGEAVAVNLPALLTPPVEAWTNDSQVLNGAGVLRNPVAAADFVTDDPDFGTCYEFPNFNNLTVGQAQGAPYEHGRIYEVTYRFKVIDDGAEGHCDVRFGVSTFTGTTEDVTNEQTATQVFTVADGVQEVRVQFAASIDAVTGFDYFAVIPGGAAGSNLAYFHIRQNVSAGTHAKMRVAQILIEDVTDKVASANSASAAATEASNAASSATAAGASASAAQSSATSAATDAGEALTYRNDAAQSATDADGSAQTATQQAGVATTAATNAGDSADAAAVSETNAESFASDAETSATASDNAKLAAQSAQGQAEAAEGAAATSATNAAGSEAAAAQFQSISATAARDASEQNLIYNGGFAREEGWSEDSGAVITYGETLQIGQAATGYIKVTAAAGDNYVRVNQLDSDRPSPNKPLGEGDYTFRVRAWVRANVTGDFRPGFRRGTIAGGYDSIPRATIPITSANSWIWVDELLTINVGSGLELSYPIFSWHPSDDTGETSIYVAEFTLTDVSDRAAAETAATAAATSEANAAASETAAGEEAIAAQASATLASTSAGSAETFATQASQSATDADGSAQSAATAQGAVATTQGQINATVAAIGPSTFESPLEAWSNDENHNVGFPKPIIPGASIITGDPEFGTCFEFPDGGNRNVGPTRLYGFTPGVSVYEVLVEYKVADDGDGATGTDDDHRIGMTLYEGETRDGQLNNMQADEFNAHVADGVQIATAWFTDRDDVNDLFSIPADRIYFFGNTTPANGANNGALFHFRQNAGTNNNQVLRVNRFEVRDVTDVANTLVAKETADGFASAAATSAQNAAASETGSEQSATASEASRVAADTARGGAETAQINAAQSATDADGSASSAASSATIAADAATAAGDSATAAAGSASTAAAEATDAGQKATAAEASRVAAETAEGNALASESAAATSEGNAAGSASSAASSETVAATAALDASESASGNLFLDPDFLRASLIANWGGDGDITVARYNQGAVGTPSGFSLELTNDTGTQGYARHELPQPLNLQGRRLRMTGWVLCPVGGTIQPMVREQNNAGGFESFVTGSQLATQFGTWHEFSGEVVPNDLADRFIGHIGVRFVGAQAGDKAYVTGLRCVDVTEQIAAETAATASATSEANAAASATEAGQEASAAEASRVAAETAEGNALASESAAATSETNAAGSASSAASSQVVAATASQQAVIRAGGNLCHDPGAATLDNWSASLSAALSIETHGQTEPSSTTALRFTFPDESAGVYGPWTYAGLLTGRIFEVRFKMRANRAMPSANVQMHFRQGTDGSTEGVIIPAGVAIDTGFAEYTVDCDFGANLGDTFRVRFVDTAREAGDWIEVTDIEIRDVTAQRAASASASAAATSATTAAAEATDAGESAETATTQAGIATTKAGEASTSATAAASSKIDAESAAVSAVAAEGVAVTLADAADVSATAAANSASVAEGHADDAETYSSAAQTAQVAAEGAQAGAEGSETLAAGYASDALGHSASAQSYSELAARAASGGGFNNPMFSRWDGTYPDGISNVSLDGGTITKNTADARYTNAIEVDTGAVVTNGPFFEIDAQYAEFECVAAEDAEMIRVQAEVEKVSGSWGGAMIRVRWQTEGSGGDSRQEQVFFEDDLVDIDGVVQELDVVIRRPDNYVAGSSPGRVRVQFYGTSNAQGKTQSQNVTRIHRLNATPLSANATARILQEVKATTDGWASSVLSFRAKAGTGGAELELVALDTPEGSASVARIAADDIVLDGTIKEAHIEDLSVSTLKIQDDAVTIPVGATTGGTTSILTVSYYTPVEITVNITATIPQYVDSFLEIVVNGTQKQLHRPAIGTVCPLVWNETLPAGTHTITAQSTEAANNDVSMLILGTKK